MTSSKVKGQKKELLAQKILESEGWTVFFRSHTVKFGPFFKGLDFADLFDLVASRIVDGMPEWIFLSVKHLGSHGGGKGRTDGTSDQIARIIAFRVAYGLPSMSFQIWFWKKPGFYGRGKKRVWNPGGFERKVL